MTNQVITNANGGVWTFAKNDIPSDTALAGRFRGLIDLLDGSTSGAAMSYARAGVVSTAPGFSAGNPNALGVAATGSGLTCTVYSGAAIIERGTYSGTTWSTFTPAGSGPYPIYVANNGTITASGASTSSTRIDRVDLQILDGPGYGDNGGVSLAQIIYTAGVAGSGNPPNGPANSIPLALLTIPANTTTLTNAMISDMRRSAGIRGGIRVLLPGDALTDPGTCHGELRDTSVIRNPDTIDRWDNVAGIWRPVWQSPSVYQATFTPDYLVTTTATQIATVTVTTCVANATVNVTLNGDYDLTATGTGYAYLTLYVDGVAGKALIFVAQAAETRIPGSATFPVVVPTAGTHIFALWAHKDINSGTAYFRDVGTSLTAQVMMQ